MRNKTAGWLLLTVFIIGIDRLSKYWALKYLTYNLPMPVLPHLNLTLSFNTGAAFSFLANAGGWQQVAFLLFAIAVSVGLLIWLLKSAHHPWRACALALIIAGALSNAYDRFSYGYVIDYFDFYWGTWHFAIFNVADSAVCVGAFLLLLDAWIVKKGEA